jgi:hypothetical protein
MLRKKMSNLLSHPLNDKVNNDHSHSAKNEESKAKNFSQKYN